MTSRENRVIPVLLGGAVCIALSMVLSTILSNVTLWITVGGGVPITQVYAYVWSKPWFIVLGFLVQIFASGMGGYTAAAYGLYQPYLNALIVGVLLMAWYLVMLATPIQTMNVDTLAMISWFLLPAPAAIFGAYIRRRKKAGP
jgi:hypothetical protein